ncbi:hypothetical protein F4777DRAFT_593267 [Nemania sp. FL0916]|nr:hypothetical protein F4777DRAFT_593267 [Nemania sp. FL0916]
MTQSCTGTDDPVVIVGLSFRFPQDAVTEEAFWDIMYRGTSTMTEIPKDRWNINGHHVPESVRHGTSAGRGGHFVKGDVGAFDASFFSMAPQEAQAMDPEMRLLLETSYHALESAGIPIESARGSPTSVFVGNIGGEYRSIFSADDEINATYEITGTSGSMMSNRLSWFYDLRGPSLTLDTACSSSLSLACGTQINLEPRSFPASGSRIQLLSPDSHSYSFDDRANGYSRGEGVGVIVLKRLSKALENGDTIRAVIRSTGSNQDGHTPTITQPNSVAQVNLIQKAYDQAGLDFGSTMYFEAHGTGTTIGDSTEAQAIGKVFSAHRTTDNPLFVGSLKANIGHLESTAGIAGIIKAIMVLEKGVIPPNALLKRLNPMIHADDWNLHFPTVPTVWSKVGLRRVSVNSFGFGGTNAHVILDDALHYLQSRGLQGSHNTKLLTNPTNGSDHPVQRTKKGDEPVLLFPLSASDEGGIQRQASALVTYLAGINQDTEVNFFQDLAFTLGTRRTALPWKSFALGSSTKDLTAQSWNKTQKPSHSIGIPSLYFIFTGQGAQWAQMGVELLHFRIFRESLERASDYFRRLGSSWSLLDELHAPASTSNIHDPRLSQPICTALQTAMVDLLSSWGIIAQSVIGHSSGEIAAAYCSGYLTEESAWRVAYYRGEVIGDLSTRLDLNRGSMLVVALSEAELTPYIAAVVDADDITGSLTCACINSNKNTTVSGVEECIDKLACNLQSKGIFACKFDVPVAYHSRQMLQVANEYQNLLGGYLKARDQGVDGPWPVIFSSVTGEMLHGPKAVQAEYWVSNLVSQVKFSEGVQNMLSATSDHKDSTGSLMEQPTRLLIEVGPHCALERAVKDNIAGRDYYDYDYVLRRTISADQTAKHLAGRLFTRGYPIDFLAVNNHEVCQRQPKALHNLPSYPFDHSNSYWLESRLSRNHRFRGTPRQELLGVPSRDWNPLEPSWRFTIRANDLPWILDHKIETTAAYPAAGMLVAVLEAIRNLTTDISGISGYRFRDVRFMSALVIPLTDEGIETQVQLHSQDDPQLEKGTGSWDFRFYSISNNEWKLHCGGQVCVEQIDDSTPAESHTPKQADIQELLTTKLKAIRDRCSSTMDRSKFYKDIAKKGAQFGSTFQTLKDIKINNLDHEAVAVVEFSEWKRLVNQGKIDRHVIHPATLDGITQVLAAAARANWDHLHSMIPTEFLDIHFSSNLFDDSPDETMITYACVKMLGVSSLHGDIIAIDSRNGTPLVTIQRCRLSNVGTQRQPSEVPDESPSLFHRFDWKPDVSLLSQTETEQICQKISQTENHSGIEQKTEIIARHFVSEALDHLEESDFKAVKPHLRKYIKWAQTFIDQEISSTNSLLDSWPDFENSERRSHLIEEYALESDAKKNIVLFGQNLANLLRGKVDPLDLLFNQGIAVSIYRSPLFSVSATRLAAYMDLLVHKTSDCKILEIGAGTGGATDHILYSLHHQGRHKGTSARFDQYDFTDISTGFFANAQDRYGEYADRMRFKALDIEGDPIEQGFEADSYDVIVAFAVLHATRCLETTLKNVKKLLRPGGKLILGEPTNIRTAIIPFLFGVTTGWWLASEHSRASGPLMTLNDWQDKLLKAGFTGLEVALQDGPDWIHCTSLMVTSVASPISPTTEIPSTAVIYETTEQSDPATSIQTTLESKWHGTFHIMTPKQFLSTTQQYDRCICLIELGHTVMNQMTEVQFTVLQRMIRNSKELLWITDDTGSSTDKPEASMISGFSKVITHERPIPSFIHLKLTQGPSLATNILRIIKQNNALHPSQRETDILEEDGMLYIPRVVEAPEINALLHSEIRGSQPKTLHVDEVYESRTPIELRFSPGLLDSFHFAPDTLAQPILAEDELEVSVKAAGINFKDVMVSLNKINDDHIGQEFAGEVTRVGSSLTSSFSVGDKVCGIANGTFRTLVRVKSFACMRMPSDMAYTEAAAIPIAFATAQYGLCHLGQLKPGETVLIHAAAGAVGQAAIQIAQSIGAIVMVTVGSSEKQRLLMDQYGIPSDHFFSSRNISFAQQIMRITEGRGVDVILNSLSGQALAESWRCLAPLGRFVEIGKRDIRAFNNLAMMPFDRNTSFCSLDIAVVLKTDAKLMGRIMKEVEESVLNDISRRYKAPHPLTIFKRSEIESALRLLQTGRHMGKLVINWAEADDIQMIHHIDHEYRFDSNATYLIAGGLDGVGRSIAKWMCRHGARHLILLSRSGARSEAAKQLVTKLKNDGVEVYTPSCDISRSDSLRAVLEYADNNMPPVKGCIQGAMALENRIFSDYTPEDFQAAIDPKVKGTWNLHHMLPRALDFFVILSSVVGVYGLSSQSNYAAAGSFLDAFARYRYARGEHCITIDLGVVEDVGYVAERVDNSETLAKMFPQYKYLHEPDIHFMLKYACNPKLKDTISSPWETQLMGGLTTPAFMQRGGGGMKDHLWMRIPLFRHLYQMERNKQSATAPSQAAQDYSAASQLRSAATLDEKAEVVTALLVKRLARSLAKPAESIDASKSSFDYGVDSLVAVELQHWFSTELRAEIPVVQILGRATIAELGLLAAKTSEHVSKGAV